MRSMEKFGLLICLLPAACKSTGTHSATLDERGPDAKPAYNLLPFLGAFAGDGINLIQSADDTAGSPRKVLLKVATALRDAPSHPDGTVGAVRVTTTTTTDVAPGVSETLDYAMIFQDAETFQIEMEIGGQQVAVGGGRCGVAGTGLVCPIKIPALNYDETFTFARNEAVPSTIKAEGSKQLNGDKVTWTYSLVGNPPGYGCTGFDAANDSEVSLTIAEASSKTFNAVFNELKPLNDNGATFSIAWFGLARDVGDEGTNYTLVRSGPGAVRFRLRLKPHVEDDGRYKADWAIAARNDNGSIFYSEGSPMPMSCVKNH